MVKMGSKNIKMGTQYNLVKLKVGKQTNEKDDAEVTMESVPRFGKRYIQAIILFLSLSIAIAMRAHLSVTVVAMTDYKTTLDFRKSASEIVTSNIDTETLENHINSASNVEKHIENSGMYENSKNLSLNLQTKKYEFAESGKTDIGRKVHETDTSDMIIGKDKIDPFTKTIQTLITENRINEFNMRKQENHNESSYIIVIPIQDWSVFRTYNWSKFTQEMVTGSFFVGYTAMQLPMSVIAHRFGGKKPILLGLFANAVLSIITPWAAIVGWWAVCLCRVFQGMTQAGFYPGIHTILGKWAPANERGRLSTYIYTGSQFGTILAFQMAGFLAGTPSFGWPSTFWTCGLLSFACFILFWFLGAAAPDKHPTISETEKQYIMGHDVAEKYKAKRKTPWKAILTSLPVWAIVLTQAGTTFGYNFLLIETPVYLNHILHVNIKNNGLFSSLPYLAMYVMSIGCGHTIDLIISRDLMSVINARRLANSFGSVLCPLLMISFTYAKSVPVAVALLVSCLATHSGVHVGFMLNQIDLTPNFAGTLMALGSVVGNFASLSMPVLVSVIVKDMENQTQWQTVCWITAAIMIITNTIFVVFIKVDVQPWNDIDDVDGPDDELRLEKIPVGQVHITMDKEKLRKEDESKL